MVGRIVGHQLSEPTLDGIADRLGGWDADGNRTSLRTSAPQQMGQNAAALLDSVCAAIQRIAYVTLTVEWAHLKNSSVELYEDEHGFSRARGYIESGDRSKSVRFLGVFWRAGSAVGMRARDPIRNGAATS
jgi:hypothetical protein